MIGIFKKNLLFNSLLLLPYCIVLRMHSLMYPEAYVVDSDATLLTQWIFDLLPSPLLQSIIGIFLVFLQAVYINRIVIRNRIGINHTLIPGMIYIVLSSMLRDFHGLSPHLIVTSLMLVLVGQLFKTYKNPRVADTMFSVGFCIGLSALLLPEMILAILFGIVGIFILRSIKGLELVQMLSGAATAFIIFYGYAYVFDSFSEGSLSKIFPQFSTSVFSVSGQRIYVWGVLLALILIVLFNYRKYGLKKSIQSQKKIDLLFWLMLFSGILIFFSTSVEPGSIFLLCIPLAIFLSVNFLVVKSSMVQEIVHLVILTVMFALQFGVI